MKQETQNRIALFAANTSAIKTEYPWHHAMTKRMAALLYTQKNKEMNCQAIRECHELIKSGTGVFSTFRGNMSLCVSALLSLSANRLFGCFALRLTTPPSISQYSIHENEA